MVMPLDLSLEKLLERAKDQEKKYGWLYAVWTYEQSLLSVEETGSFAAEIWQQIGFCYERASRQTEDVGEFSKLRQQAVEAYQEAARQFEKINTGKYVGKIAQCNALAEYSRSWLASASSEKAIILDECRANGEKALQVMPYSNNSLAAALVKPTTPALAAAYSA